MQEIKLLRGRTAIVDDEDFEELSKFKWHCTGKGYVKRHVTIDGGEETSLYIHVSIMGKREGQEIDHINGDPLDNRRCNLRHVTHSQNMQNQIPHREGSLSRYKGVCRDSNRGQWVAYIRRDKKKYHLGRYKTERAAALAYNKAATKYFGEYARLNIIEMR